MPKITQAFMSQPLNTSIQIKKKQFSFSSLLFNLFALTSLVGLIVLLIITNKSIREYIYLSNKAKSQSNLYINKERERNAIYHAIFKEQNSIKQIQEENIHLKNKVDHLINTKFSLIENNNDQLYQNSYYLYYKKTLSYSESMISQNDYMFIVTLFPFWEIGLKLLFKASIDGDTTKALINHCLNTENLIVVILLDSGLKIGGYASGINWKSNETESIVSFDNHSFLFNINKEKKFPKYPEREGFAIENNKIRFNRDLIINDNYLKKTLSRSEFPSGYINNNSKETGNVLTQGMQNLIIKEIEVFNIKVYSELTEKYLKKD